MAPLTLVFLDVEASGLHRGSYPVEIGWVSHDLTAADSFLVRPTPEWGLTEWSPAAERVHGLSLPRLAAEGLPPSDAAERLNRRLEGAAVLTDSPSHDGRWLRALYEAAATEAAFEIPVPAPAPGSPAATAAILAGARLHFDADALITVAAARAGVSAEEHEAAWRAMSAAAGLTDHHALDDALSLALGMQAVDAVEAAKAGRGAAADEIRGCAVAMARRLRAGHGRR